MTRNACCDEEMYVMQMEVRLRERRRAAHNLTNAAQTTWQTFEGGWAPKSHGLTFVTQQQLRCYRRVEDTER